MNVHYLIKIKTIENLVSRDDKEEIYIIKSIDNRSYIIKNTITNEEISIGDIKSVEIEEKSTYEYNHQYNKGKISNGEAAITIDLNAGDFSELFGFDSNNIPEQYDIQYLVPVQKRKHKKKRINKKWLKQYGYANDSIIHKGWKLKTYTDGTFEFVRG